MNNAAGMTKKAIFVFLICFLSSALFGQDGQDALVLYREGKYNQAVEVCLQEINETPRRTDSYVVLGWSYIGLNKFSEALSYSQKALEFAPNDYRLIFNTAQSLYFLGRRTEALDKFEQYVAIAPTGMHIGEAFYYMAEIFIAFEEFNHADIALSSALYHNSNVAAWWLRLGYAREKAKEFHLSLSAYQRAFELNPNLVDAYRGQERVKKLIAGG